MNFSRLLANNMPRDLAGLERPFTREEIKAAVFSLGGDKAPGPDGFPMQFFKQCWEMVKDDVFKLCEDFHAGRARLERINWANVTLIPKVASPDSPGDYRPISLINSSLKIVSKILATRLGNEMNALVDNN